jgi:hypothetical protein
LELKRLLKRGALIAAANWPVVVIQFGARTTFQTLLAAPVIGAAILLALLLGADLRRLLSGGIRDMLAAVSDALLAEPAALLAFAVAFGVALLGATAFMALIRGGTVAVLVRADIEAAGLELEPLGIGSVRAASRMSSRQFIDGATRHFRRYAAVGILQLLVYGLSAGLALAFLAYAYGAVSGRAPLVGWALIATLTAALVGIWITIVNVLHLLMQIAIAVDDVSVGVAGVRVARFLRAEARAVGGVFLVLLLMTVIAMFASALAWSGVALVAFVPLVGLAVAPLQIAALLVRGLVFEYIGLTGLGAYATLYRRFAERAAGADARAPVRPSAVNAIR